MKKPAVCAEQAAGFLRAVPALYQPEKSRADGCRACLSGAAVPLNLDVTRISRETVAAVPQKYFGPGFADMSGVGPEKLGYCPETDCYYSSKGAAQYAGDFQITGSRRLPDGTGADRIQQEHRGMLLRPVEKGCRIISNMCFNSFH